MTREMLQVDQESYRLLVESVADYAIFMVDVDGYILSWNRGAENIKGYTADEIIGKHFSIFYTPDDVAHGLPQYNLNQAKLLGRLEQEGWRVRKDGSRFWATVTITPLKDEQGNLIGFGKVTRDITSKHEGEDEIQQLYQTLEDQLLRSQTEILDYKHALDESSIVAITDQKGIIKYVNENFCKISKYSREELIGQDHRIINSGFHPKEMIRELWTTIAHGRIWRGELKNKAKDGTYYWVDTTIVPFLNEKGKPYQYVAIRSDITQRKIIEEQILRINEELEQKVQERTLELTEALNREKEQNEVKSRFVSMASHEFRTPLSTILSSISLIDRYQALEDQEKRHKHIERIKSSVRHLTDILDDFLSFDRLEQGKVEIRKLDFNLRLFVEETIDEMAETIKKKNQHIQYLHNGPDWICQDRKILHNILLNLLSNASKYSGDNKSICISTEVQDKKLTLIVRDEGIGIPLAAQEMIFNKYFRAGNAISIQGTGLGLNIVKKYLEILDGSIHFNSVENQGTTFTVELPQSNFPCPIL